MTVKAGEVAFIKTSGEAVFVLTYPVDVVYAEVRRPIMGQDGVRHVVDKFRYDELETQEERRKQYLAQSEEFANKYASAAISKADGTSDDGFVLN